MAFGYQPQYGFQPNPYGFGQPGIGFGNPTMPRRSLYVPRQFMGYEQPEQTFGSKLGKRGASAVGNMLGGISGNMISKGIQPGSVSTGKQQVGSTQGSSTGSNTGAAIGTAAGAGLGTIIPGVGNIVGGALGGLIGGVAGDFLGAYFDEEPEPIYARAQLPPPAPMPMTRIQRNQFQPTYSQRYGVSGLRGFG